MYVSQLQVLACVLDRESEGLRMGDLAKLMGEQAASVARTVDKINALGFGQLLDNSTIDPTRRTARLLKVTERGKKLLDDFLTDLSTH